MKTKFLIGAVAVGLAASLSSCGGPSTSTLPAPTTAAAPVTKEVKTAKILGEAQQPSESAEPDAVNNGVLVFTDASDATQPITIDAVT